MAFQPQPLNIPNGLPASTISAPSIPANFLPPSKGGNFAQHFPPSIAPPTSTQPPIQFQQQHYNPLGQQQQHLLTNGGSNTSSRTGSPALNQTSNITHYSKAPRPPQTTAPSSVAAPPSSEFSHQPNQATSQNSYFPPGAAPPLRPPNNSFNNSPINYPSVTQAQPPAPTGNQQGTQGGANFPLSNGPPMFNANPSYSNTNMVNGNQLPSSSTAPRPGMPPPPSAPNKFSGAQTNLNGQNVAATTQPQFNGRPPINNQPMSTSQMTAQFKTLAINPQSAANQFQNNNQPPAPVATTNLNTFPSPQGGVMLPPTSIGGNLPKRPNYPQTLPPQQQPLLQQPHQSPLPPQPQQQYQQHSQAQQHPQPWQQQQQQLYNGYQEPNNQQPLQYQNQFDSFGSAPNSGSTVKYGFNKLWGNETVDLMQQRHVLPPTRVTAPNVELGSEFYESVNCSPDILRCTLTKIPETSSLLQKSRLPLGILIHPFRDLNNLPVIQCSSIVRCKSCRTYINPFVHFIDSKKWRCNLCYRTNELPEDFQYDPVSKSYGDVTRRPEVKSSTIEFIAPSEYMVRPPQPAIYLFLLDVSQIAQQSGYLEVVCAQLAQNLEHLPGDARTQVGFIAYNGAVHFYSVAEGFNQPHEITVVEIDDPFLPCPDNLLINLNECRELIKDLLNQLPSRFENSFDSNSALGAALQVAFKLLQQSGGRVTVFQTCLPNVGPGSLKPRENPNDRSAKDVQHLGPATDFYKRLALECSGQQIAVDLFLLNSQYSDLATLSGISKFSGGCIHHFPLFNRTKQLQVDLFRKSLERYLTRKIGFESVMRVRCTHGLTIHTFHGNFFVRSTDLLSLPNVNPDAGFAMQISHEESLSDVKTVCFQAALLYTSSKGERRIRVHTLCLPVTNKLSDVINSADCQAIIGLISKMAVDRSLQSSISDARDAFVNASIDVFSAFRVAQNLPAGLQGQLLVPRNLTLLPLYMMALLKHVAFRTGTSTRLDDRIFAMCELKSLPLDQLIRNIYPDFYVLDELFYKSTVEQQGKEGDAAVKYEPPLLQLSAEKLDSRSVFMLDTGPNVLILVGTNVPVQILENVFGVSSINELPDLCIELPETGKPESEALHAFIDSNCVDKPHAPIIQIIRDTSPYRASFTEKLVDDRSESSLSYYEFIQHLRSQVK